MFENPHAGRDLHSGVDFNVLIQMGIHCNISETQRTPILAGETGHESIIFVRILNNAEEVKSKNPLLFRGNKSPAGRLKRILSGT